MITAKQIIDKLNNLKGDKLAMVYASTLITQKCAEGPDILRRTLIEWTLKNLSSIKNAIIDYRTKRIANIYPNPYNQSQWGNHLRGEYADSPTATYEKHIARGLFFWQREGRNRHIPLNMEVANEFITNSIGTIKDYEVPLFYTGKSDGGRKIDLVSIRAEDNQLFFLELKNNKSPEPLLRCLLEVFTYSLLIDRSRAKESFGISQRATIVICPIIFKDTTPYHDLVANVKSNNAQFKSLIQQFEKLGDIKVRFAILLEKNWLNADGSSKFPPSPSGKTTFLSEWFQQSSYPEK